jgi:hypothetical protein
LKENETERRKERREEGGRGGMKEIKRERKGRWKKERKQTD